MADIIGWDLGGAHLKAVRVDGAGRALSVVQLSCTLWRGLQHLELAVDQALSELGECRHHAVTMTGELADIFQNRREGVMRLVETLCNRLPGARLDIFAGQHGFVGPGLVPVHAAEIASANWLASAQYAARRCGEAIFVDMGSTTTDIAVLHDGQAKVLGLTDAARLATEELVYTGVVRTPLMAVVHRVPFAGQWQRLAAEHFATMADVHRLTGQLDPRHDMAGTADSAGKSLQDSARRLARMVGRDLQDADMPAWVDLARFLAETQLCDIRAAVERALSRGLAGEAAPLIGAGAGSFMVRALAGQMRRDYVEFSDLVEGDEHVKGWASICAPAMAVAWLARESAA